MAMNSCAADAKFEKGAVERPDESGGDAHAARHTDPQTFDYWSPTIARRLRGCLGHWAYDVTARVLGYV